MQRDSRPEVHIRVAHEQTRRIYGVERLHAELVGLGIDISASKVRTMRSKLGVRCKQNRRFKYSTNSQYNKRIAPNLLEQCFDVERPNQVWVSDITYVWTNEGWLHVAGLKDLFTREIVGYAIDKRMTTELCVSALNTAMKRRKLLRGLDFTSRPW
jgi:transposase InsO family protein